MTTPSTSWYVFDLTALRPGDIILSTVPTSLLSTLVRTMTVSDFSHAAIATDQRVLVEARGIGVARVSLARLAVRHLSSIRVLRLRPDSVASGEAARVAGRWAESMVGRPYSRAGALLALVGAVPVPLRGGFFCSYLVAEAYSSAGVNLLPDRAPDKVTPGNLAGSALLVDITESAFRVESMQPDLGRTSVEDGPAASPHHTEVQQDYQKFLELVRPTFVAFGLPSPLDRDAALLALLRAPRTVGIHLDKACASALDAVQFGSSLFADPAALFLASRFDDGARADVESGRLPRSHLPTLLGEWRIRLTGLQDDCRVDALAVAAFNEAASSSGFETFRILLAVTETAAHGRRAAADALARAVTWAEAETGTS